MLIFRGVFCCFQQFLAASTLICLLACWVVGQKYKTKHIPTKMVGEFLPVMNPMVEKPNK